MPVYMESDDDCVLTAKITGEIDHHSAKWLRADIDTAINDNKPQLLRLDFSGVTFMDSSGVGLVMGRNLNMKEIGGKVELVNMPPYIERVMSIAGMDKLTGTVFGKGGNQDGKQG
ncbi:MAG: STAS domain-containing protein [Oscillospiraceae bacterium]|nr:STAS domain-containing protein [Oscillospiraceae bacterium]